MCMFMKIKSLLRTSPFTKRVYRILWELKIIVLFHQSKLKHRGALRKLSRFKDIHEGQRCFVIGNGPSLLGSDLDLLKNEITFASNRIFEIFNQTTWRPTYYGICDRTIYRQIFTNIKNVDAESYFLPLDLMNEKQIMNFFYFARVPFNFCRSYPKFSSNIVNRMYEGGTITYYLIQIAAYMGFSEIVLLGVDFNYSISVNSKGEIVKNENVLDYFYKGNVSDVTLPNLQLNHNAYIAARRFSDKNGIKILNASRNSKLDVFEKINFDEFIN